MERQPLGPLSPPLLRDPLVQTAIFPKESLRSCNHGPVSLLQLPGSGSDRHGEERKWERSRDRLNGGEKGAFFASQAKAAVFSACLATRRTKRTFPLWKSLLRWLLWHPGPFCLRFGDMLRADRQVGPAAYSHGAKSAHENDCRGRGGGVAGELTGLPSQLSSSSWMSFS